MKLMMSDYDVKLAQDSMDEFFIKFEGPRDSLFEGGVWKVHVELPDQYPYKSPSIGFVNKIFHPNIDELSGSVCLDVINQTWSPMFDLLNIFDSFLPQLLQYPNPTDPLNGEAAALMMREPDQYKEKVKEYVKKFATEEVLAEHEEAADDDEASELSSLDDYDEDETSNMELWMKHQKIKLFIYLEKRGACLIIQKR